MGEGSRFFNPDEPEFRCWAEQSVAARGQESLWVHDSRLRRSTEPAKGPDCSGGDSVRPLYSE
jgi:hypothetical protein